MAIQATPLSYQRMCKQAAKYKFKVASVGLIILNLYLGGVLVTFFTIGFDIFTAWMSMVAALLFITVALMAMELMPRASFLCHGCNERYTLDANWTCGECDEEHKENSLRSFFGRFTTDLKLITDVCYCQKHPHSFVCPHCKEITIFDPSRTGSGRPTRVAFAPKQQEQEQPKPREAETTEDILKEDLL
jgi:hypothetical protein